ncbi:MAG TPA: oligosaccharide flippase family protein [Candidatus Kapabacteria bacterium]|nr:oligosaccharide flippase family protein [Candidatus Kapabacteria bacterium]HOV91929.1 oligosaccharide flippase family protein [Candidatus Kapabacteria bacterium]
MELQVSKNINRITWTISDKSLFLLYGFVNLVQIRYLGQIGAAEYSFFILTNAFIMTIADSFALESIVQYKSRPDIIPKANLYSFISLYLIIALCSLILIIFGNILGQLFKIENFVQIALYIIALSFAISYRYIGQKYMVREFKFNYVFYSDLIFFGSLTILSLYYIISKHFLTFPIMANIYIFSAIISSLLSLILTLQYLRFSFKGNLTRREFFNFGGPMTINGILTSIPKYLDIYIIKLFFPMATVGVYSSAKTLFRLFDEGANAVYGFIYPTYVKYIGLKDYENVRKILIKSSSFVFLCSIIVIIPMELGLTKWLINLFLSEKFINAIPQFNLIVLAGIAFPMFVQSFALISAGNLRYIFKTLFISNVALIISLVIVGFLKIDLLIPIGLVVFYFTTGLMYYFKLNKDYDYKLRYLFQSIPDSINFVKSLVRQK